VSEAPIDPADDTATETIVDPAGDGAARKPGSSLIRS
jgi:hypothetical protein